MRLQTRQHAAAATSPHLNVVLVSAQALFAKCILVHANEEGCKSEQRTERICGGLGTTAMHQHAGERVSRRATQSCVAFTNL